MKPYFNYAKQCGAFDHEEEILPYDGIDFGVISVRDEEYQEYELQGLK